MKRLRYYFDNIVMKGALAHMIVLVLLFVLTSILSGIMIKVTGIEEVRGKHPTFFEAIWSGFTHAIDPGTIGGDSEWHLRIGMLVPTIIGIFLVSSLISIINTAFTSKIQELKKGRSLVIEQGHTVIFGWSPKVVSIIKELMIAHANQKYSCIVILSEENVDVMKDEINNKIGSTGKTKVIFRHGNPRDPNDIHIANINYAKSIILMSPVGNESDAFVVKSLLAIVNHPQRRKEKYNIIAEIAHNSNREITQIAGNDEVTIVVSNDIIAKITVQAIRQTGLSVIYSDLIDFGNVEMYILPVKNSAGRTYKELIMGFENVYPIGVRDQSGKIILNPPADYTINKNDKVIVIAEDDSELTFHPNQIKSVNIESSKLLKKTSKIKHTQRTLFLGWNKKTSLVLYELDNYILPDSEAVIVADVDEDKIDIEELKSNLKNQTITFIHGDIKNRKTLLSLNLERFDDIVISSYSDVYGTQEADAVTIIALMHLRDIASKQNLKFNIVTEMMDVKSRNLAELYKVDDFIVSDLVISNILAQLSENKELAGVFQDLFSATGNEIYLKPASDYVELNKDVNLYELSAIALAKGETCIGYKIKEFSNDASKNFGLVLTPEKSRKVRFKEDDKIIIISEE
ncbi:MAG: NAD-binding protein [Cytophagaceae bacterium]|nr:NAD-binding protein [Cytophagaceae bacterium]MDW8455990.1 NAD-binding protein [Cytophagaceae bacterium]